jgi:uncharacterized membrane protein
MSHIPARFVNAMLVIGVLLLLPQALIGVIMLLNLASISRKVDECVTIMALSGAVMLIACAVGTRHSNLK